MKVSYIKTYILLMVCSFILTTSSIGINEVIASPVNTQTQPATQHNVQNTGALAIVNSPSSYLNKVVVINAKFDKFSTLGLDYKPAYKSSDEYISFLIKRDDSIYDIPLSELKLFLKKQEAEKFIELKSNDEIRITGTVFSNALGDAWIDVTKLELIKKTQDKKDGV